MPIELNDEQMDFMEAYIAKSGIEMQSLRDDLLDHLCCLVEANMGQGDEFQQAFDKALQQTSPNGLEEIHRETVFLLSAKKLRLMRLSLFFLGLLSTMAFCMGFLAKVMHWPGANITMYSGLVLFCGIFAPLWVINYFNNNRISLSGKFSWVAGVAAGIVFTAGSIFKVLHYPGANLLMLIGMSVFSFLFLPFLFFRIYRPSGDL